MADIIIKHRPELVSGRKTVFAVPVTERAKKEFIGFTERDDKENHYGFFLSVWEEELEGKEWMGLTVAMEE